MCGHSRPQFAHTSRVGSRRIKPEHRGHAIYFVPLTGTEGLGFGLGGA